MKKNDICVDFPVQNKMESVFHQKYKYVIDKSNREKIFRFLSNYVQTSRNSTVKQNEMLYFLFYELHVEWSVFPKIEDLFQSIKRHKFSYSHPVFSETRALVQEEEDFIMKPPDIEEGVIQCKNCKSKKTFSYSKQTRSSDEAVTIFVRCINCGAHGRL